MAVYESRHVEELGLTKKQHVAASGAKRIDTTKYVVNFRGRFTRLERCNCQAEKTGGRRLRFAQLPLKLLNSRSQQPQVNVGVSCIGVPKISRRKHDGFLVKNLSRRNGGALGGKTYRLCESRANQVDQQGT